MARIRTIKPEFFTSEDIVSLSPLARLLYIALWCEADKRGRLSWKPKTFKMRWLPGDECDITALCEEITSCGVVILYGVGLAYIPCFEKHQHVNPRETDSSLPDPDGWVDPGPKKVGKNLRETILERDGYKCTRCGSDDKLQVDHILPQSCGGPHISENLRTLCRSCNAGRPVSGIGLDKDLALDGFSIESLRVKYGIDASNLDVDAQVGREGKGREGVTLRVVDACEFPGFAKFWETWPTNDRKQAKGKCLDAWKKANAERDAALVIGHVLFLKNSAFLKDGGQFIPAPLVYLNQRRWEGADVGSSSPTGGVLAGAI